MAGNTISDLIRNIENAIIEAVENEASNRMVEIVKEHIDSDVYDKYNPTEYKRTKDLKNSVQKTIDSGSGDILITIDHDDDKLNYESILGQEVYQQGIPIMIEKGKIHPLFGGGFSYLQPRPYMHNSEEEIKKNLDKIVGKAITNRLK